MLLIELFFLALVGVLVTTLVYSLRRHKREKLLTPLQRLQTYQELPAWIGFSFKVLFVFALVLTSYGIYLEATLLILLPFIWIFFWWVPLNLLKPDLKKKEKLRFEVAYPLAKAKNVYPLKLQDAAITEADRVLARQTIAMGGYGSGKSAVSDMLNLESKQIIKGIVTDIFSDEDSHYWQIAEKHLIYPPVRMLDDVALGDFVEIHFSNKLKQPIIGFRMPFMIFQIKKEGSIYDVVNIQDLMR